MELLSGTLWGRAKEKRISTETREGRLLGTR
jgi:hypothetical protein